MDSFRKLIIWAGLASALTLTASGQGTAFSYQGKLNDGLNPANGLYDLQFGIFDAVTNGDQLGSYVTNSATPVSNGLFTVTLDFGNQFPGDARWLDISVRTNGAATFVTLAPRQELTSTPYSIQSANATSAASAGSVAATNIDGTLSSGQLPSGIVTNGAAGVTVSGTFTGNGGGLTNVSAAHLTSIGNTSASQNFFVGPSGNATTTGSQNTANGFMALQSNTDGFQNTADGFAALHSNTGGFENTANGYNALYFNLTGQGNTANGAWALANNTGSENTANGGFALGSNTNGSENTANGVDALGSNLSGSCNTANGVDAAQGNNNGSYNTADGYQALLRNLNGSNNIALGYQAGEAVNNGSDNIEIGNIGLSADNNLIRIGSGQTQAFIAGVINGDGGGLTMLDASQLISIGDTNGGTVNFFVGPSGNATTGGSGNTGIGFYALSENTSGAGNTASGYNALSGNTSGSANTGDGVNALENNTSGSANTATGYYALWKNTNGIDNTADGYVALVNNTSGSFNTADGYFAMMFNTNGSNNSASGAFSLYSNTNGSQNIALGYQAGFNITGSSNIDIGNQGLSTDANLIRIGSGQSATFLTGSVSIGSTNFPMQLLTVGGGVSPAYCDGTTWVNGSDRNAKRDFSTVDPREVLAKVAALPLSEWQYKAAPGQAHLGPMAQDFHAAFGLNGSDDKHIATVDEGGVALAAIQGLNEKVEDGSRRSEERIQELEAENVELKARLEKLERMMNAREGDGK